MDFIHNRTLPVVYDYMPVYEIYVTNTQTYSKDIYRLETIFHTEIKGHYSDNNRWILSFIELGLYFMIIYLCIQYESNTPMDSKDIARKTFLYVQDGTYVRTYRCMDKGDAICPPLIMAGA